MCFIHTHSKVEITPVKGFLCETIKNPHLFPFRSENNFMCMAAAVARHTHTHTHTHLSFTKDAQAEVIHYLRLYVSAVHFGWHRFSHIWPLAETVGGNQGYRSSRPSLFFLTFTIQRCLGSGRRQRKELCVCSRLLRNR